MIFKNYIDGLQAVLERIKLEQEENIARAGKIVAESISQGGIIHTFGTGHSHMIAEEVFFRAGGIAPINPILDERLIFLKGALESTRAERESGLAASLLEQEDVRSYDAAIIISNSGRNAAPVEMALEMKQRGVRIIAITNLEQSQSAPSRHASGKRLYELADVAIDNCVPTGDALVALDGLNTKTGASSTVAGAAIAHSIIIESLNELLTRGEPVPVLTSANVPGTTADTIREVLSRYRDRIKYLDLETEFE
jgi:uncharacterized phosphosugar-binding protein